ncbi:MAG: DUF3592 domain-containing protein [Acidobacteria bacterium]|nr:DUF3592 domain-containing protein [Acidobacteriota bacterium]
MPSATPMNPAKRLFLGRVFPWTVVVIGALGSYIGVANTLEARASLSWPTVEGVILRASVVRELTSSSGGSAAGTLWRPVVAYEYVVGGTRSEGERIAFGEYATGESADAEAVVARYPAGASVEVHYDPEVPGRAVLEPGTAGMPWFFLALGAVFLAIGLLLVVVMPKVVRPGAR